MTQYQGIISRATIEGNILRLNEGQLDRKVYQDVAKAIELIGGKWKGGKTMGFVFNSDPTEKVALILNGEKIISTKKEYQYFETPVLLAHRMVEMAEIQAHDSVLEPSAGQGAIVHQIVRAQPTMVVDCFELMPENQEILKLNFANDINFLGADFLADGIPSTKKWDRIIANPPFSNNQDIDHVRKMFCLLAPKGILVSIMSPHWTFAAEKKCVEFREWFMKAKGAPVELDPGAFKESGTAIRTILVKITKP